MQCRLRRVDVLRTIWVNGAVRLRGGPGRVKVQVVRHKWHTRLEWQWIVDWTPQHGEDVHRIVEFP